MKLERVSLMGLTRFLGPVSIDFSELGDGLVSLSGPNGAGKTTLLEAPAAALFRSLPSRPGSLYEYAHGRDAYIEAEFRHEGQELLAKVLIDAEGRKTEGYLTVDGAPVSSGKARDYEAAVAARFGSAALFLASVFAAQNRAGDFLAAPRASRKALFAELLGLQALDALASAAGERALVVKDTYARLGGEERALAERVVGAGDVAQALAAAAARGAAALSELKAREQIAKEALAAAERAQAALEEHRRRRNEAETRLGQVEKRLDALRRRREETEQQQQGVRERYQRLRARPDLSEADRGEAAVARGAALDRAAQRRQRAQEAAALEPEVVSAIAEIPAVREHLEHAEAATTALVEAEQRRDRASEAAAALEWQASDAVAEAACHGKDDALFAACGLVAGARKLSTALEEARGRLERAQEVVNSRRLAVPAADLTGLRQEYERLQRTAEKKAFVEQAAMDLALADDEEAAAEERYQKELGRIERAQAERTQEVEEALADVRTAEASAARVLLEVDDEEEELYAERVSLRSELHELAPPEVPDPGPAERALREAQAAAAEAGAEVVRLEERKAALEKDQAALDTVRDRIDAAQVDLAEWRILAEGLGRNGVQALEIDAAGPAVAALTNELLEACYGPRFSLSFETLREKRSKAGEFTEVFDIHVYDGPRVRPVEALSGGERVIVGEALSLALAVYNAQQSHVRWETLWRDETAGALDPSNAQAYVDMLRKAMALGGFRQVVYVSHVPDVWARADVSLRVEDGEVTRG